MAHLRVRGGARAYDVPAGITETGAQFADGTELVGYRVEGEWQAGRRVTLVLYWRGGQESEQSWTVFSHLLGEGNRVLAQHDGIPGGGTRPTSGWAEGEVVEDRHELSVSEGTAPGEYEIEAGLYDARSGERLSLDGGGDRVVLGRVSVK